MKLSIATLILASMHHSDAMDAPNQTDLGKDPQDLSGQFNTTQEYTKIHSFNIFNSARYITLKINNSDPRVLVKDSRIDPNVTKPVAPMSDYYTKNDYFNYNKPYSKEMLEDEYQYGLEGVTLTAFSSVCCWTLANLNKNDLEKSVFKVELSTNAIPSIIFNKEIPFPEFTASPTLHIDQSYDLSRIDFSIRPLNRETAHLVQMCSAIRDSHGIKTENK